MLAPIFCGNCEVVLWRGTCNATKPDKQDAPWITTLVRRSTMTRSSNILSAVTAICFTIATFASPLVVKGDEKGDPNKDQPVSIWMKKKLEYSQNILAGIANADFDTIVTSAESMRNLSKIEGFVRGKTPGYRTQLQIFEESADEIIRQAKKDNVDGAALAFTQLTISCVNCHKHLRETK
jgi:hypothetical protein